jgi:sn-glycerol 3-phosphate transport system ATP-binding protein
MTLAQRMIVMNGGHMEQFGTPEEVYNRPASTFVASFIGSPPMNLLQQAPGARAGHIMGIRPEHLDITAGGDWTLQVDTVELLGAERLVHARLGQETLTLRLDASIPAPEPGGTFHATPRAERLHWFDAATQKRIA